MAVRSGHLPSWLRAQISIAFPSLQLQLTSDAGPQQGKDQTVMGTELLGLAERMEFMAQFCLPLHD